MILTVFGTTGEVIKLAPVLDRLQRRQEPPFLICTGQHVTELPHMLTQFGLPQPDLWLGEGRAGQDLKRSSDVPGWLTQVIRRSMRARGELKDRIRRSARPSLTLVQGDTFTTVIGAIIGRGLKLPVAHIEAGVRSFDLLNPFPEEANRRVTTKLARIHYAPGEIATANLAEAAGEVVDTHMNTVQDALAMAPEVLDPKLPSLPEHFGVVSLHRFELINDKQTLTETLETLARHAKKTPLVFINHPITAAKISQYGLDHVFDEETFIRVPKLSYFGFITLVKKSAFSVTDSGGLQQESFCLDHPCLVHRKTVETFEGLGANILLSKMDQSVLETFLEDPSKFRRGHPHQGPSPSDTIVEHLAERGYC